METGRTENRKLIYELSKIARSSESSAGLIYYKKSLDEDSERRKIWAKRSAKKGYSIMTYESDYYLFQVNEKGLELLRNFPEFYLHVNKKNYNENQLTTKERRRLRQQQKGSTTYNDYS